VQDLRQHQVNNKERSVLRGLAEHKAELAMIGFLFFFTSRHDIATLIFQYGCLFLRIVLYQKGLTILYGDGSQSTGVDLLKWKDRLVDLVIKVFREAHILHYRRMDQPTTARALSWLKRPTASKS
jgi:hypothetical protein